MSLDNMPDEFPSTESHGELVPPPRKPPTALTAPASGRTRGASFPLGGGRARRGTRT
jgi:hypothetical protein